MFVVAEITRLAAISNYYAPMPEHPFVVSRKEWYGDANEDIATFWSDTFGVTEPLTLRTYITGVVYNITINYSVKDSLSDCLLDSQSYFWNNIDQILSIHYNQSHKINTITSNFDKGIAIGLTDDKIRYFENRPYWPYLIDFPQIEVSVDKFNYNQLSFIVDTMQCDNRSGFFNQFKTIPLYGNKITIKTGKEGDEYGDLIERANYYVDDYTFSAIVFDIFIQDIRKTLTAQIPNKVFSVTDYPDIGSLSIGKTIPFAYSPSGEFLYHVPGHCINEEAIGPGVYPDFIFLEIIVGSSLSDIEVWVKDNDDVWVEQTVGVAVDWDTGIVTVNGARTLSGSNYSTFPVKANVCGIANAYASDIITDLNDRFLGLLYDSSNYDTTEWETEEVFLEAISLYMDSTKDIYEWIRELQSLSSLGFRYTNTANNKRTIRVDNPNRDSIFTVPAINVRNIEDVKAESNKDDVYNKIYIGYNFDISESSAPRAENTDYFNESFAEYKIERVYNKISGLITEANAIDRALIQAEDYYQIHKVFEVELIGEQYLDLRLYDIITVNIDLRILEITQYDVLIDTIGAKDHIVAVESDDLVYIEVLSSIVTELVGDEYFGEVRGQIVSKRPNYDLQTNTIRLRQKGFSIIWEGIHG